MLELENFRVCCVELMLLGFISLLLTVFQGSIAKICIPKDLADKWMPCDKPEESNNVSTTSHYQSFFFSFISPHGTGRRLLTEASNTSEEYCSADKVIKFLYAIIVVDRIFNIYYVANGMLEELLLNPRRKKLN